MRDTFWHPPAEPRAPARQLESTSGPQAAETEPADPARVTARTEPPTHVVDAYQRGDFTTISAAIKTSPARDRILVRPGLYQEGLVIDKPLEILGDGPAADIQIQARGANAVLFKATIGRIANLTLRQAAAKASGTAWTSPRDAWTWKAATSPVRSLACVAIHDGADPRLRRNTIHDGKQPASTSMTRGWGHSKTTTSPPTPTRAWRSRPAATPRCAATPSTTASRTASSSGTRGWGYSKTTTSPPSPMGVEIETGGNPTLRRNPIHDSKSSGVYVQDGGLGTRKTTRSPPTPPPV